MEKRDGIKSDMEVDLRFSLKDVCSLTGVSHQSIRMYEKWGVLPRIVENGNGYRYYHYPDLQRAVFLRYYASMGVHIKSAAALINGAKVEDIEKTFEGAENQIEEKIRFYQIALESVKRQRTLLGEISNFEEKCEIVDRPAMYRLNCSENGKICLDGELLSLMKEWAGLFPVVMFSGLSRVEDHSPKSVVNPGYAILAEYKDLLSTTDSRYISFYPQTKAIRTILRISSAARDFYSMGTHQDAFVKRNGYKPFGDIVSVSIANKALVPSFADDPSDYVCAWTQIA